MAALLSSKMCPWLSTDVGTRRMVGCQGETGLQEDSLTPKTTEFPWGSESGTHGPRDATQPDKDTRGVPVTSCIPAGDSPTAEPHSERLLLNHEKTLGFLTPEENSIRGQRQRMRIPDLLSLGTPRLLINLPRK